VFDYLWSGYVCSVDIFKFREVIVMGKKLMLTAIGLGAAYLYRNKEARQKLKNFFQSSSDMSGASGAEPSGNPARSYQNK
jgi:hypothetical protein